MPFLLDSRYQEVAAEIEARGVPTKKRGVRDAYNRVWQVGFQEQVEAEGWQSTYDVYALLALVGGGSVSGAEADAFLNQKYPDQKWSGGRWGDQSTSTAEAEQVDKVTGPTGDPSNPTLAEQAVAVQTAAAGGGIAQSQAGTGINPIILDELPHRYDQHEVQEILDDLTGQISASLDSVSTGRIEYQANSIPGDALVPGSISSNRMDRRSIRQLTSQIPGPEDAIILETAISGGSDRWVDADEERGPGRILEVTRAILPRGFRPQSGPVRFRVEASR